jgi:hypothetical protein
LLELVEFIKLLIIEFIKLLKLVKFIKLLIIGVVESRGR